MAVNAHRPLAMTLARLDVSQKLVDLIEERFPGTLARVRDEYDWTTAHGHVIRLSVRDASELLTRPVDTMH